MLKLYLTVILVIFYSLGMAQSMQILAVCKESGQSLPYVHVCTEDQTTKVQHYMVTDSRGLAEFNWTGPTVVSISFLGYQSIFDTVKTYQAKIKYQLKNTGFNLNEVVVTGHHEATPIDQSIYQIKVIDKDDIEKSAGQSLTDALSKELNISLSNDPSTGTGVKIQGISGDNVKILIDGVPVIGRVNGNIDLSQIDLSKIDHIEVVEGPMSVIYGSNALAGVINLITKQNLYSKWKFGAEAYHESSGTDNINFEGSAKINSHFLGLSLGRNFFGGFDIDPSDRTQTYKPKEQYHAGFDYAYRIKKMEIKNTIDFFNERLLDRGLLKQTPYVIEGKDTWFNTLRAGNHFSIKNVWGKHSSYTGIASYSFYQRTRLEYYKDMTSLNSVLSSSADAHDTTRFDAGLFRGVYAYETTNKKWLIQSGYDVNLEFGTGKRLKSSQEAIHDFAAFVDIKWDAFKNFTIQPGFRMAYNTKYKAPISPAINIKYQIKKVIWRGSYARGFRAPSLKELYLNFYDSNHQIEGNENLKAEYSHNFNSSISYPWQRKDFFVDWTLKGFYNQMENLIALVQIDPDNALGYRNENVGSFKSLGFQVQSDIKILPIVNFGIGFSRTGRTDYVKENEYLYSNNLNADLTFNLFKNTAHVSLFYKYFGEYPYYTNFGNLELNIMKPYHQMDIIVSKKWFSNQLTISTGIKNLFDNIEIASNSSGGSTSSHGSSSAESPLVGWGRTWFVALKYSFSKY